MPFHGPMGDVHTIGGGGGSIARIDEAGLLRVGPESAGATPGPICFGRGGIRPTIADANLVLGRLNHDALLAVVDKVPLDIVRARPVETNGKPLGLDAEGAAAAVLRIPHARTPGALRIGAPLRRRHPR